MRPETLLDILFSSAHLLPPLPPIVLAHRSGNCTRGCLQHSRILRRCPGTGRHTVCSILLWPGSQLLALY